MHHASVLGLAFVCHVGTLYAHLNAMYARCGSHFGAMQALCALYLRALQALYEAYMCPV